MAEVTDPSPGIKIVADILIQPGVDTLEGVIGPLLNAERGACHFIDMPAGLFLDEHPHSTESLIYTVHGQWVLCSSGVRTHMKPGSLFWFGDNIPTGFEVPFEENAYILIFKTPARESDAEFLTYLKGMAAGIDADHKNGTPFLLGELPEGHPALEFAASLKRQGDSRPLVPFFTNFWLPRRDSPTLEVVPRPEGPRSASRRQRGCRTGTIRRRARRY